MSSTPPGAATGPAPSLHVVVVARNDRGAVLRCLESVLAARYPGLQALVVDNASEDGTAGAVQARFPCCGVRVHDRNLGFAAGANAGFAVALARGAAFVLLLNQDTVIDPALPGTLVRFLASRPAAGAVAPRTCFLRPLPDGRPKLLYGGAWRGRLPLRQRIPGIGRPDPRAGGAATPVDYAWGHGMMLRAGAIREVGGFDPGFFFYYEDLDLCRRLRRAGFEVWYEPAALMWHDVPDGARATASEPWRWTEKVRSMHYFHHKHYGPAAAAGLGLLTVAAEALQLLRHRRLAAFRHLLGASARTALGGLDRVRAGSR